MRRVFHLIPHTHWDREWYVSRARLLPRLVGMMDELVSLLERHPELRFTLDGQTIVAEDYLHVRPRMRDRLARLVALGRLAVGPWYVLADELIPTEPSLVRNLFLGQRDGRALGGSARVLLSPDAFGHPHFLPRLAARSGLRWAVVWRGVPSHLTLDLFRWRCGDATVLAHQLPPEGYEAGAHLPGAGSALRSAWIALRDRLAERSATRHVAVPIGADHHWPHPALPRLRRRLQALDPSADVRWSRWEDYFAGVERSRASLPELEGELRAYGRTWVLQGVHGTRARMKRLHSAVERAIIERLEPLLSEAARRPEQGRSTGDLVESLWRQLIQAQFHDTIAGTVSDPVAQDQQVRLDAAGALADELIRHALHRLVGYDADRAIAETAEPARVAPRTRPAFALFNPLGRAWRGVVVAPVSLFRADVLVGPPGTRRPRTMRSGKDIVLRHPSGRLLPMQVLSVERGLDLAEPRYRYPDLDLVDRMVVACHPGVIGSGEAIVIDRELGARASGSGSALRLRHPVSAVRRRIENGLISVTVSPGGDIMLIDRRTGLRYRRLLRLVDEPDHGDCYTPEVARPGAPGRGRAGSAGRARIGVPVIVANGPLVAALRMGWSFPRAAGGLGGSLMLSIHADAPVLRCRLLVDNRAPDHRLSLELPGSWRRIEAGRGDGSSALRVPPSDAGARMPSGEVRLPTDFGHDYLRLRAAQGGLMIRHAGFFELQHRESAVALTVLRAVGQLSRFDLEARPGHAAWPTPTPTAQEPGEHGFDLSIAPLPAPRGVEPLDPLVVLPLR